MAQSVQNYFIRQVFACSGQSSSDSGGGNVPCVGQYTKSITIPYDQRHSNSPRDRVDSMSSFSMSQSQSGSQGRSKSPRHTFGDEKYNDSFMQQTFCHSGYSTNSNNNSLNNSHNGNNISGSNNGDHSPSAGQYTKAVVIPYYQRHATRSSKSPTHFQRHTWGSEKYDTFINDFNSDSETARCVEYNPSNSLHSLQHTGSDHRFRSGSGSNEQYRDGDSISVRDGRGIDRDRDNSNNSYSRQLSPSNSSRGRSQSQERDSDRGRGPPRSPGEHRLRKLLTKITSMGTVGGR